MSINTRIEYYRQRKLGNAARQALRAAKTNVEFKTLEDVNVRLRIVPDESPDLSYLDDEKCFPKSVAKAEYDRANNDGVWGIIGEYRCKLCGEWKHADSVWGFIGDDWKDSGYDVDVKQSTLDQFRTQ